MTSEKPLSFTDFRYQRRSSESEKLDELDRAVQDAQLVLNRVETLLKILRSKKAEADGGDQQVLIESLEKQADELSRLAENARWPLREVPGKVELINAAVSRLREETEKHLADGQR